MESPNTQESASESIKRHQETLNDLVRQDTDNLKRRMDGEISGVESDRLNTEIDGKIDQARQEIRSLINQMKTEKTPEESSGESSGETVNESSDTNIEEPSDVESEVGDSLHEKLGEEELYADRVKNAPDLRNLVNYIAELGDITAPDGYVYKKEDMLGIIGNLKDSNDPNLQKVTRTYGLRDKVKLLLIQRELGIS